MSVTDVSGTRPRAKATTATDICTDGQVGHLEWDIQNDVLEWEPALFSVFGIRAGQVVPSWPALLALKHPDDLATSREMLQAFGRGEMFSYTNRIFREDGSIRQIHAAACAVPDGGGLPGVVSATIEVVADWEHPFAHTDVRTATDGALMLGLRGHMPDAQAEAYQRYSNGVQVVVRQQLGRSSSADDIVHDVFESLFRSPENFDARRGSLKTYLKMTARSRCIDLGRSESSRHRRERLPENLLAEQLTPRGQPVEEEALSALMTRTVHRALASLPPKERMPIELAYVDGLTYREVAEYLNIPEGTAKSRIRSGLRRLRIVLDPL